MASSSPGLLILLTQHNSSSPVVLSSCLNPLRAALHLVGGHVIGRASNKCWRQREGQSVGHVRHTQEHSQEFSSFLYLHPEAVLNVKYAQAVRAT